MGFEAEILRRWEAKVGTDVFRTSHREWEEREVPGPHGFVGRYSAQHWGKKRGGGHAPVPSAIDAPFDPDKFNFNKIAPAEVLMWVRMDGSQLVPVDSDEGDVLGVVVVNASPMFLGHSLLVPHPRKCLNQVLTPEAVCLAMAMVGSSTTPHFRVVYNSLDAFASINHLHLHPLFLSAPFPVERTPTRKVGERDGVAISMSDSYPCHVVVLDQPPPEAVLSLSLHMVKEKTPHNIVFAPHAVFFFPRKSQAANCGVYKMAVVEVAGYATLTTREDMMEMTDDAYSREMATDVALPLPTVQTLLETWGATLYQSQ
eukprot:Sspe_Gene.16911::Locus_5978_Transcript_1_3_Confidence_0.400_Length_1811::g.16911::m.16911